MAVGSCLGINIWLGEMGAISQSGTNVFLLVG